MLAFKLTPAKRCYVFLCNDFNQSQLRIFNKSKHVKNRILFVVRSINHAGAVLLLAVGNVDFDWVEITFLMTYRAKLLNPDWLRQRAFFLNHEGTFGNQEGMIT